MFLRSNIRPIHRCIAYFIHRIQTQSAAIFAISKSSKIKRKKKDEEVLSQEANWLFDLIKAFDEIECSHKSDSFSGGPIFLQACATCSELPSNISTAHSRILFN